MVCALIAWSQKKFETRTFLILLGGFSALGLASFLNGIPAALARFSTEEPRFNQIISLVGFGSVKILVSAVFFSLLIAYLHSKTRKQGLPLSVSIPTGFSIGIIITLTISLLSQLFPRLSPTWEVWPTSVLLFPHSTVSVL